MRVEENIPAIIDDLYAGALDDAAWHRGIMGITNLVRGASAIVFGINPIAQSVFRAESHNIDQEEIAEFTTHWADKEIRIQPALRCGEGDAYYDQKLMPMNVWKRSAIYNEFLLKIDRPWILGFCLHKLADKCIKLSIHGSRLRGPLGESDAELIKPLIPHVGRALKIRDRLENIKLRTETLRHGLDDMRHGILVLDARGRILECSAVAQELMRQTSAIRRHADGTLWLHGLADAELHRWILAGTPPPHNSDGLLHVPRLFAHPL